MLSDFQRLEYKYLTKAQETKQQLPLGRIPKGLLNSLSFFLCHAFRLEHFHHMPFSRAVNARGRGGPE